TPPRSPAHRLLDPQSHGALEDITLHRQLGVLLPQPSQLRALVLTQRPRRRAVDLPIAGDPVRQRPLIDPQITGDRRDRLPRLLHDPHGTSAEVRIELSTCFGHCHLLIGGAYTLRGEPQVGCSEPTVVRWRSRLAERGLAGLADEARSG